jgi:hypothetical protein
MHRSQHAHLAGRSLLALVASILIGSVASFAQVLTGTVGPGQPVTVLNAVGSADQIAYLFGNPAQIYTIKQDGSSNKQITSGLTIPLEHIAVSRNLRHIAGSTPWQSNNTVPPQLYVLDLVGKKSYRVFTEDEFKVVGIGGLDWDASGNLYVGALPGCIDDACTGLKTDLYKVSWGTGNPPTTVTATQLTTTDTANEGDCAVSADSNWITFVREYPHDDARTTPGPKEYIELWKRSTTPGSGVETRIYGNYASSNVEDNTSAQNPFFSPDGTKIIFDKTNPAYRNFCVGAGSPCTAHDIYTISASEPNPDNPTTLTRLSKPGPISIIPSWSSKYANKGTVVYTFLCDHLNKVGNKAVCGQNPYQLLGIDYAGLAIINATDKDQTPKLIKLGGTAGRWVP